MASPPPGSDSGDTGSIPLEPDLRRAEAEPRIPSGDARVTRVHDAGGLAPMPIRPLPEPPADLAGWRAYRVGLRRRRPRPPA